MPFFEVPVGCRHVLAFRQSVPSCSCRLCEVLAEEAVLRPFGKLYKGGVVCPAAVKDPHFGEGDIYYCDGAPDEVYGADGAFWVMGSFLRACVVGEYGVVRRRKWRLQVFPQAGVDAGGHTRMVEYPAWACAAGPLCGLEADHGDFGNFW